MVVDYLRFVLGLILVATGLSFKPSKATCPRTAGLSAAFFSFVGLASWCCLAEPITVLQPFAGSCRWLFLVVAILCGAGAGFLQRSSVLVPRNERSYGTGRYAGIVVLSILVWLNCLAPALRDPCVQGTTCPPWLVAIGILAATLLVPLLRSSRGGLTIGLVSWTLLATIITGGWIACQWQGTTADENMRSTLRNSAVTLANSLPLPLVQDLSFSTDDRDRESFRQLTRHIRAYAALKEHRLVYTMAHRNGNIVFGPENLAPGDPLASPPGTVYRHPSAAVQRSFDTGSAQVTGPYTDEYGTFVTAVAPITAPGTVEPLALVGVDILAEQWDQAIRQARLVPLPFITVFVLLVVLGSRLPKKGRPEVFLAAASGIVLTIAVSLLAHDEEVRSQRLVFRHLADFQATSILDGARLVRDHSIMALRSFFAASDYVDEHEFTTFTSTLVGVMGVESIAHLVPATDDEWQIYASHFDPSREKVEWTSLLEEFEALRQIIETAAAEDRVIASDPLLLSPHDQAPSIIAATKVESRQQRAGVAITLLEAEHLLLQTLTAVAFEERLVCVDFLFVAEDGQTTVLAHSDPNYDAPHGWNERAIHPFFAFGQSFAVRTIPGPGFLRSHPRRAGFVALMMGLLLTTTLTLLVATLATRRRTLENLVTQRTAELDESRNRFDQVANLAREVIWEIDHRGIYIFVSQASIIVFGYRPEEIVNRLRPSDLAPDQDRSVIENAMRTALNTGSPFTDYHNRVKRKDGEIIHVLTSGMPVMNESGEICGFRGSDRDVTDQRRANEELREANRRATTLAEQAEAASRAKSDFLATMSHEIRTPLNAVIGMTNLLLDTELNDEQRRYGSIVRTSGESLLALVNDVLDFSKIEAGRLEFEEVPFNPAELLNTVLDSLLARSQSTDVVIRGRVDDHVPRTFRGDPARLRQILLNLGSNAVKFTEQGSVELRISSPKDPETRDDGTVALIFSVSDTGIGIAADRIDRLFSPFVQVDGSITRRYGGTGLGLAITKRIVDALGGQIEVESTEGKGSTFRVSLRLTQTDDDTSANLSPIEDPHDPRTTTTKAHVLVVEDNAVNSLLVERILTKRGHTVISVPNGFEALATLQKDHFDIVFMDCQMPEMDGYETTKRMRAGQAGDHGRNVPVIALTAHALAGDKERCFAAGMTDYLTKPLQTQALEKAMDRALGGTLTAGAEASQPDIAPLHHAESVFDLQGFCERTLGDVAIASAVIEAFLDDLPVQLKQLDEALEADNRPAVVAIAHRIKGAAASVGGRALSHSARCLEEQAATEEGIALYQTRLQNDFSELSRALRRHQESGADLSADRGKSTP